MIVKPVCSVSYHTFPTPLSFRFAFDFNPALQPRSIVVLGCISKEANDMLVQKLLQVLIMVKASSLLLYVLTEFYFLFFFFLDILFKKESPMTCSADM